jgi:miniconductance mechanosensitive channel
MSLPLQLIHWEQELHILLWTLLVFGLALCSIWLTRRYLLKGLSLATQKTVNRWDDALVQSRVFEALSWLVPLIVLELGFDFLKPALPLVLNALIPNFLKSAFIFVGIKTSLCLCDAILIIYRQVDRRRNTPIKGFLQLVKIFFSLAGLMLLVEVLTGYTASYLISCLGALTAVLLLIFKDTLLSLVSSIQISTQNLIRVGDWIEAPAYGADGDVEEIALHNITIRNWDHTISILPTADILSKGFKNWRSMSESGGRRIKRQVIIDLNSVKFLSREDLEGLKSIQCLRPYLYQQLENISHHEPSQSSVLDDNTSLPTNLGCFRFYLETYLKQHPMVHSDGKMTFLVRHLQHTDKGLPIEIYVFCKDVRWVPYEGIQADIFDHIFGVIGRFGLKVYQSLSGEIKA